MHKQGVNIVLEFRFYIDEAGQVYTDASFDYQFWQRYLMVFSNVNIIARAKPVRSADVNAKWKKVTGESVSFSPVPFYHGVGDLLKKTPKVIRELKRIAASNDYPFIFRMPSIIAALFFMTDRSIASRAFGVEMVGDPEEVFSSLSPLYRPVGRAFVRNTRNIIGKAKAVAYVERSILPVKYPAANHGNVFYFSSINLPDNAIATAERVFDEKGHLNIISIGSLDQMYKGPDILLDVIAACKAKRLTVNLTWIGGGIYLERMKEMAASLGLQGQVNFTGMITDRQQIEAAMDKADIFVLASRTEGLPRAMIEAMARGLPCIGSNVGGIPELLTSDYLFTREAKQELEGLLLDKAKNTKELTAMSKQNIETAKRYANSKLDKERVGFYNAVLS
ncbi:MAG TPA: glycosyltransferase [Flavipsychrobacter sp.]|nr:glycosyltransferase [Flavipsychrobacter sp.]